MLPPEETSEALNCLSQPLWFDGAELHRALVDRTAKAALSESHTLRELDVAVLIEAICLLSQLGAVPGGALELQDCLVSLTYRPDSQAADVIFYPRQSSPVRLGNMSAARFEIPLGLLRLSP